MARSCFAASVACLLGGGIDAETHLAQRIEERITELGGAGKSDLALTDGTGKLYEEIESGLDLVVGVALGWVHARRSEVAGSPVAVSGFPHLPPRLTMPAPSVPGKVLDAAYDGTLTLPIAAIRGTLPARRDRGVPATISRDVGRPATDPTAVVPPMPTEIVYDQTIMVSPSRGEIRTDAVLREGDALEITVDGRVEGFGPDGHGKPVADGRFPVHVGIDPKRSKADAVVGRLNGYFVVGAQLRRQQWLHFGERMLYLRLNRLGGPGAGSGAFSARVQVWSDKTPLEAFRYVSCVRRDSSDPDRRIDGLGGVERNGTKWLLEIDDVLWAMDHHVRFFVTAPASPSKEIVSAHSRRGFRYLRTAPGGVGARLSDLPACP